jgi:hypothetical protein
MARSKDSSQTSSCCQQTTWVMLEDTYGCHNDDKWYLTNKVQMWLNILQCQDSSLQTLHPVSGANVVFLCVSVPAKTMLRYLVRHYFWVYPGKYFWNKLSFDYVDWKMNTQHHLENPGKHKEHGRSDSASVPRRLNEGREGVYWG